MTFKIKYAGRRWAFFSGLCLELNPTLEEGSDGRWTSKAKQRTWLALREKISCPDLDSVLTGVVDMTGESFPVVRQKALERCVRMQRETLWMTEGPEERGAIMRVAEVDVFLVYWQLSQLARATLLWCRSQGIWSQEEESSGDIEALLRDLERCFWSSMKEAKRITRELTQWNNKIDTSSSIAGMVGSIAWRMYNAIESRPFQAEGHGGWTFQKHMLLREGVMPVEQIVIRMLLRRTARSATWSFHESVLRSLLEQSANALIAYPPTTDVMYPPTIETTIEAQRSSGG